MLVPGLVSVTFREKSVEQILSLCSSTGLQGIEWGENAHVFPDDESGCRDVAQKTKDAGLRVVAYGSYYKLGQGMDFRPSLKSAKALGAPVIRVWAGVRPSSEVNDEDFEMLCKEASDIAEYAKQEGIKVAFEWHKNSLTDTNESAEKLLHMANNANLYCLWQPIVALSEKQRIQGIQMLMNEHLNSNGRRLAHFHVFYWKNGVRRPLQEGIRYWHSYIMASPLPQEDIYFLLEFVKDNSEEQFYKDVDILKQLCKYKGE